MKTISARSLYAGFVVMAILAIFVSSCGAAPKPAVQLTPRLQKIKDSGQFVIGTALTAPFEFRDAKSGELKGLDIDLAQKIADKLGVPIVWKEMAFADLIPTLQAGKVDMVIAGMYITEKRKQSVDMTDGYVDTGLVAVTQASATNFATAKDMAGKIVCVKTGSTGAAFAQKLVDDGTALTIQEYADTPSSLVDLSKGLCDAALNDKINSLEYIKTHPELKVGSDVFQPAQFGMAVQKGDAELLSFLNDSLKGLKGDGSLEKLYNTWVLGK